MGGFRVYDGASYEVFRIFQRKNLEKDCRITQIPFSVGRNALRLHPTDGGMLFLKFFTDKFSNNMRRTKTKDTGGGDISLHRSSLYREFLAEREEILRHKWLESEKAGHDIGYDRALLDWIMNHREKWRNGRNRD